MFLIKKIRITRHNNYFKVSRINTHSLKFSIFKTEQRWRQYCIDKHGKEHNLHFAIKNNWISDNITIQGNEIGKLAAETLLKELK